jgi:hypothetical protein
VNLKEWAARQGVSYVTGCRWFVSGKLPVSAEAAGPGPAGGASDCVDDRRGLTVDRVVTSEVDEVARAVEAITGNVS